MALSDISDITSLQHSDWQGLAAALAPQTGLFIDGDFIDALDGSLADTINPANGEVIAQVACGGEADINRAVASAKAAWQDGRWRFMAPRERITILTRMAQLIEDNSAELALLESLDMGKPIGDALNIDLPEVVSTYRYFAECIDKLQGSVTNTDRGALHMIEREPLGVVGAISPWNYPLLMAAWKVAPALAAGNCVVLKPALEAPLSCLRMAQLFVEAGGPPGVFNVVNGEGPVAGKALAQHMDVAKISFTGSTAVGKQIMIYAGQSNLKRVALETGGKSPQIFMPDLNDLDTAVDYAYGGIFDNAGQVCNAGSRLLVHESIHDAFVSRLVERGQQAYQPGDPLDPATSLGPLVSRIHQQRVLGHIDRACSEGAQLACGGAAPVGMDQGAFVSPTLFTGVSSDMSIARDEVFGPVAAVMTFRDEAEALQIANDSIYGLAASVWTSDLNRAHRMTRALEAGVVWLNCFGDGDMTQPFGGYKQSGNTRDKSFDCLLGYTQSKSAWLKLD
ncbi:aldehyde dehydrogenase [Marinobacterium jannaschii]|uniref:aldehyde dehydrogenase n=1 Tax=Marinobacterium jannaschii TaxID=64970 RepID=UPI000A9AE7E0|nr:aldehyde dehydrogenase [Marinobacterium jannaschii]